MTDEYQLSRRELEVLGLLAEGEDSAGIARRLFVSVNTVMVHRRNIIRKMRALNMVQAVSNAFRGGVLK